MTRHGFKAGIKGPHGGICPPLPLVLAKSRPSREMQKWGIGTPRDNPRSAWAETTSSNTRLSASMSRKQRQKVLGIGLDGSGSRRSFLGELSEAAGPAAEKDIGKITYRYQPAAPTAKKQPKWKSFPALSRRELKQKLGIPRGDSLPKELLSQTMHGQHVHFKGKECSTEPWNGDYHFPAIKGDDRQGCDDGTWFNEEDVRSGRAPALGDVRDQMSGPPVLSASMWSAKAMRWQSRIPAHCPAQRTSQLTQTGVRHMYNHSH